MGTETAWGRTIDKFTYLDMFTIFKIAGIFIGLVVCIVVCGHFLEIGLGRNWKMVVSIMALIFAISMVTTMWYSSAKEIQENLDREHMTEVMVKELDKDSYVGKEDGS